MEEYILCTPGPVDLTPNVYQALGRKMIPHYGEEWIDGVYNPVCNMVKDVFQTRHRTFVIPASGSGGVESAFCSLGKKNEDALIFSNGYFGDRMARIAKMYFKCVHVYKLKMGEAITDEDIEKAIKIYSNASVIGIVHGETSTGVKNDIQHIRSIAGDRILVVDAISTLAGDEVKMDEWEIDICVSASQKAIGAAPGLALVAVSDYAFEKMQQRDKIPSFYLNLLEWRDSVLEWGSAHPYPVTLPVNLYYALYAALEEIHEEGLSQRVARHDQIAEYTHKRIEDLGLELLLKDKNRTMSTVTAVKMLEGKKSSDLIFRLKTESKILIANGQGELKNCIFRIGHLSASANTETIELVMNKIGNILKSI
ncbi:MAG: alanine--glyoxylate aminotransferase family protein [Coprococcus sp.]|nr:alanine--glyoxylate aminotransferase family protein [Coprococcus sp.]